MLRGCARVETRERKILDGITGWTRCVNQFLRNGSLFFLFFLFFCGFVYTEATCTYHADVYGASVQASKPE